MPGRQLNLLSIDGGGVKGLSALYILRKLMELIDPDDPPKPCDHFDIIGGTSTGGLIAIMLGRLEMTVDECIEQYLLLQDKIFHRQHYLPVGFFGGVQGRYDHVALEEGVKSLLRSRNLDEDTLFKNPDKLACKVFVTATSAGSSTTDVLASYYRPRGAAELYNTAKIWEAARATSAASTFFEPINIGPSARRFLDGGTGANNPVFIMWEEAYSLFGGRGKGNLEEDLNCFVSVGCGIKALTKFGEKAPSLMKTLADIATETEETAKRFLGGRHALHDAGVYHRFNAPSVGDIDMDKPEEKSTISQMTDHYIDAKETQDRMIMCTTKLPEREKAIKALQSLDARQRALVRTGVWSSDVVNHSTSRKQKERFDIFEKMSLYNATDTRENLSDGKCAGTTNWILDSPPFRKWLERDAASCFALTGIVGSGKTTVTTTVVDFLDEWLCASGDDRQVVHFFYRSIYRDRLTGLDVLEAFLKQIILTNPDLPVDLQQRVWNYYGPRSGRPHISQLGKRMLIPVVQKLKKPIFVVDGLDECEPVSRQELIHFLPLLVAEGCSVFVSTRDASELARKFPDLTIAECSIHEKGVRRDLEIFVTDLINQQPVITDDEQVLTLIKTTLIDKAKAMFLWAKLLVIEIWKRCSSVEQIRNWLENELPKDLEETYSRCRKWVHPDKAALSARLFELVCGAVEPFYIDELQAMIAWVVTDGIVVATEEQPLAEVLIRDCGANLITVHRNRLVLPIHHSVQQHIFPKTSLHKQRDIELEIGEICMHHLRNRTKTALAKIESSQATYNNISTLGFQPIGLIRKLMEKKPKAIPRAAVLPTYVGYSDNSVLLSYAQRSWVQNNRFLPPEHRSWDDFYKLASEGHHNVSYPWPRFETSHLHGLFAWAVTHAHVPLMQVLLSGECLKTAKKLDLFNKPLLPPDEGFALHHAAKSSNPDIFHLLWKHSDVWKIDANGDTPLHLAARTGCSTITSLYRGVTHLPVNRRILFPADNADVKGATVGICQKRSESPLHAAMIGLSAQCVEDILSMALGVSSRTPLPGVNSPRAYRARDSAVATLWSSLPDSYGHFPLDLAIIHGKTEFLERCFQAYEGRRISLPSEVQEQIIRTAIEYRKVTTLITLLQKPGLPTHYPFNPKPPLTDTLLTAMLDYVEPIVTYRPGWLSPFLRDIWRLERPECLDMVILVRMSNLEVLSNNVDLLAFAAYRAISHHKPQTFHDIKARLPTVVYHSPDWPSLFVVAAMATAEFEILSWLLEKQPSLHDFVLLEAARRGSLDDISLLRSNPSWSESTLREAADIAAKNGHVEAFFQLRRDGQIAQMSRTWLLAIAAPRDSTGPERNAQTNFIVGDGPRHASVPDKVLWLAGFHGYADIAMDMIDTRGANVDYRGDQGTTALWQAASHGHWDVIQPLLDRGADPLIKNTIPPNAAERAERGDSSLSRLVPARNPHQIAVNLYGEAKPSTEHELALNALESATQKRRDSVAQQSKSPRTSAPKTFALPGPMLDLPQEELEESSNRSVHGVDPSSWHEDPPSQSAGYKALVGSVLSARGLLRPEDG